MLSYGVSTCMTKLILWFLYYQMSLMSVSAPITVVSSGCHGGNEDGNEAKTSSVMSDSNEDSDDNCSYDADDSDLDVFLASSGSVSSDSEESEDDIDGEKSEESEDLSSESDVSSDSELYGGLPVHRTPLVAAPPAVLEPCCHITEIVGTHSSPRPLGYRICGDNIDKTVRPRYMRSDKKNVSLHYFHSYAVQNRVDASNLSDSPVDMSTFTPKGIASTIIPSLDDDRILRENIAVLISRVLVTHLNFFSFSFNDVVDWHIEHQFSSQMSQKSTVVSV